MRADGLKGSREDAEEGWTLWTDGAVLSVLLCVWLRLGQPEDALAAFPLAALLEQFHALEALQDVAFYRDGAGAFETAMLRHGGEIG